MEEYNSTEHNFTINLLSLTAIEDAINDYVSLLSDSNVGKNEQILDYKL